MKISLCPFVWIGLLVIISGCKPSSKYSDESIYPIPDLVKINQTELESSLMVKDNQIKPFVDEFFTEVDNYSTTPTHKDIYYKFKDLSNEPGNVLGQCQMFINANILYISQNFWSTASEWDKRSLIFHELGHCALGRAHRTLYWQGTSSSYDYGIVPAWTDANRYLPDGITLNPNYRGDWPLSIMHRSIVRAAKFQPEYQYYVRELMTEGLFSYEGGFSDSYLQSDNCNARFELDGAVHFY